MIRCIVKGTISDAEVACADHGIVPHNVYTLNSRECIVHVEDYHRATLTKWFCEDNGPAPYPVGTLLWHG